MTLLLFIVYWFWDELFTQPLPQSRVIKHAPNTACVIPMLDPYDPEIRHHLKPQAMEECPLDYKVKVSGDKLSLEAENVNDIGLRYIQRVNDFKIQMSEWKSMVEFKKVPIKPGKKLSFSKRTFSRL